MLQSCFTVLRQLFPSRDLLSTHTKLKLCESLIFSKIFYCDSIYGPALFQYDSLRLQKIQNCCLRFAYGIRKFDHISHKMIESGWLSLNNYGTLHLLTLVHKTLKLQKPDYLFKKLITFSNINTLSTRNRNILVIPKHQTAFFKRSFSYVASKEYNKLGPEIRSYNLVNFKKRLKEYLRIEP